MKNQVFLFLSVFMAILFMLNLFVGSVNVPPADVLGILMGNSEVSPAWQFIVMESRLPQALTAMLCGAALSVCGLLLQTAFRNPLAGPGIFGITNGSALGVALVMLLLGGSISGEILHVRGFAAILVAAFLGAMIVTGIVYAFSRLVTSRVMLLIVGMMVGYLSSAAITLLNYCATEEGVRSFLMWGMGSFGSVSMAHMPMFAGSIFVGLIASILLVKPLNVLLLGDLYAESLGIDTHRLQRWLLLVTGLLCAVTTAFCGPIAFIGLAVPHLARLFLHTENQRRLLPGTMLMGAVVALFCNLICTIPSSGGLIPLNAVTPLVGAPVIIYVVLKMKRSS